MQNKNKNFSLTYEELKKIFEKLKSQAQENQNRTWTAEEILKYHDNWNFLIKSMSKNEFSWKELNHVIQERNRCLKNLKTAPQEKIIEINKVEENEIESAVSLLKNPRSLDNSSFRGYEASAQQNDTLDILEQIKKNVRENKNSLEKLKQVGFSEKDITKNKIVRSGQFPNLKNAEIISRTKETLTLIKGRSLFIYELKRLELKAPAVGQIGEKLDIKWPLGQEKAQAVKSLELEKHKSRVRSQQEAIK